MKTVVVLSGLPGSGKTTLGRVLAGRLSFTYIDKDDILDSLLSKHASFDVSLRQRLSRESDGIFQESALAAGNSVLSSFWRPLGSTSTSGTSSDWLPMINVNLVEIYCACEVDIAVDRFLTRKRHPGHLDQLRDRHILKTQFESLKDHWPLRIGHLVEVNTSGEVDPAEILYRLPI